MTIETRIPQGMRGVELFTYAGLQILGPVELEVAVENWGYGEDDEDTTAADLGVPRGMEVRVVFKCVPFDKDLQEVTEDMPIGRYYASAVHVGTTTAVGVTSTMMGRISMPKILRAAVAGISGEFRVGTLDPDTREYVARSFREPSELGIAGAWAYGRLLGEDPTKYVQTAFGIKTRQAAAQRVSRARNADPPQLPPTRQGAH